MAEGRKTIYDGLQSKLGAYPVDDFVRAYLRAYLEADIDTIKKLQALLLGDLTDSTDPTGHNEPDAPIGAPIQPRPHLNSGAITLPEPEERHTNEIRSSTTRVG
jgi:hypothetical protein